MSGVPPFQDDIQSNTGCIHKCKACVSPSHSVNWNILRRLLQELDITLHDKNLILARFHQIYEHIEKHHNTAQMSYNTSKLFIATTSVVNPALLSIMPSAEAESYTGLFWLVWSLQIAVSLMTAYTTFFKWDKKYFMYMVYRQRVEQEIWMYLELTGPYSIVHPLNETEVQLMHTTHQSKIKHFLLQLEKLYKKLKESDFNIVTTDEHEHQGDRQPQTANKTNPDSKLLLRQKLMTHKIDKQLEALEHATTEEQKQTIRGNIERLQTLQRQNQLMDAQLGPPLVNILPQHISQQEIEENQDERYPR